MGPALAFLGAVFFGVGATASLAYVVAVNLARIAILSLVSKALAPKIDLSQSAADKLLTVRSSFQPQAFVYGEDMLSGPLLYANTAGEGNVDLHRLIALTGREIDSFLAFRIDDTDIVIGGDIASASGPVTGGQFADVVEIDTRTGTQSQTAIAELVTAFPGNWTAAHAGLGWALLYTKMTLVEGNEAFESGIPQNIRALVKGSKVYDPRLAGSGGHDIDDPATWEWSQNPALILADFLIWQDVGLGESPERIDYDLVAAAADICEEQVAIPGDTSAGDMQDRYTCNFTFYGDQERFSVVEIIVTAMLGRLIFCQGKWRMWAGAPIAATVTLSEANLAGAISLQASTPSSARYNRIRGKFVDPTRNYTANPYPEQRDAAYETADNEIKYQTFDLNACNNSYEAQRDAIIRLRQSRMQRVLNFDGNWSCFRVQPGTTITVDMDELGFTGEKFFVTEWTLDKEGRGVNLVAVQEDDAIWDDPDDYVTRSPTGELIFESQPPPVGEAVGNMVMCSDGGTFRMGYSPGGGIWYGRSVTANEWMDVEYIGGVFVSVADASGGTTSRIIRSEDGGINWALATEFTTGERRYTHIMALPSGRLIVGTENVGATIDNFISSDDLGVTWARRDSTGLTGMRVRQFAYGNGILLAVGAHSASDTILKSVDDGNTWSGWYTNTEGSSPTQTCVYHPGLDLFVATLGFGGVDVSADGQTWTNLAASGTVDGAGNHLIWNPALSKLFLAHSQGIASSPDGENWTTVATATGGFNKIVYSQVNGFMFACRGQSGDSPCWASANGTTWQPQVFTPGNEWLGIAVTQD